MTRAALLLAPAALAAGCGSATDNAGGETAQGVVIQAAERTAETSGRFSFTGTSTGGRDAGDATAEGVFDGDQSRATMTAEPPSADDEGKTTFVIDGHTFYLATPEEAAGAELMEGKQWIKLEPGGDNFDPDDDPAFVFEQLSPSGALAFLAGAQDDFAEVGRETVRGVDTTHYRGAISLAEVVASAPDADVRKLYERIAEGAPSGVPADVWVDGDGFVRRIAYESVDIGSGEGRALFTTTMELYDLGSDVDVDIPDPDEVLSLGEDGLGFSYDSGSGTAPVETITGEVPTETGGR